MAKLRDKIQQQGFWDPEVSHPTHDAIVGWAEAHPITILRAARPDLFEPRWTRDDFPWDVQSFRAEAVRDLFDAFVADTPRAAPRVRGCIWECTLYQRSNRAGRMPRSIGFADLVLEFICPVINAVYGDGPSADHGQLPTGFTVNTGSAPLRVLVEAKTVLPTMGELIRQIRHYQTAFAGPAVVVAPDGRLADSLARQGVAFVQCPADVSAWSPFTSRKASVVDGGD